MQEPQVGLAGWIVELMRLLTHLFVNNPFYHPLDLHCLDDRFPPMGEDGKKQFSPSNKELLNYLTSYTRVGVLLAKMVEHVACLEVDKIDSALFDYYVFCNNRYELNYTDKTNCFGYIDLLENGRGNRVKIVWQNMVGYLDDRKLFRLKGSPALNKDFFGDDKGYTNIDKGRPSKGLMTADFESIIQLLDAYCPEK